jgi:ubiquinone/menaquinone biosynthesis C-methylase UbiE
MSVSPSQFSDLAPHYDELMQVVPYDAWADYVLMLFQIANHEPKKLLDCACGTGNVSFELAKANIDVTGVDIAKGMIEVANQKAQHSNLDIRFIEADLTDFSLGQTFDSATCLYDSLNYILDPVRLEQAFACIHRHIEPDGVFVFDMNSTYALQADLFTQYNRDPRKSLHYEWQANYNPKSRITSVEMLFTRFNEDGSKTEFREEHREYAYELEEVKAMLERTGWELERTYDAYTINLPHQGSERWFFIARRLP